MAVAVRPKLYVAKGFRHVDDKHFAWRPTSSALRRCERLRGSRLIGDCPMWFPSLARYVKSGSESARAAGHAPRLSGKRTCNRRCAGGRKAFRLLLETLEDRTVPSLTWVGGSGLWSDVNHWFDTVTQTFHSPGPTDGV